MELEDDIEDIPMTPFHDSTPIEIEPGKTLNINPNMSESQNKQLLKVLQDHQEAFSWDYTDMKGIPASLCT